MVKSDKNRATLINDRQIMTPGFKYVHTRRSEGKNRDLTGLPCLAALREDGEAEEESTR